MLFEVLREFLFGRGALVVKGFFACRSFLYLLRAG